MASAQNIGNLLTLTRRKMLGTLFIGLAAVLTNFRLNTFAKSLSSKGKILLDHLPNLNKGVTETIQVPLIEALMGRRARRFSLGTSIPDGPLKFTSRHKPLALSELEQIMLLTAVSGNTGWLYLHPFNKNYLPNIPNYAASSGGRTFPSSAGFHTSEIFFTDDNGTYFFPTRNLHSIVSNNSEDELDYNKYLEQHKSWIKKLSDERLNFPENPAHIEMHNTWCVNVPGSTLIIPVADIAQHHVASLCYLVQNGACIYDDVNKTKIPGLEKFGSLVDVANPYPLTYMEQLSLTEATVEIGTACYAGALMLQAMGLGGWMFDGINPLSVLGASGDPDVPGLGFRYDTDERWSLPNPTGLTGIFEGFCPPHFKDMHAAVEEFSLRKFGPDGPFNPDTPGPYSNNKKVRGSGKVHNEEFIECVTVMAQYVFDKFGKFPGTVPSILVLMYLQAHHLDLEFYDKHFTPNSYLSTHANHMKWWH